MALVESQRENRARPGGQQVAGRRTIIRSSPRRIGIFAPDRAARAQGRSETPKWR
ncbi:MAG: hypothetical protein OXC10_20920 [Rhodospirillaceae bacterium]|nr:hypothetical protein [Rhodospirillaceae bacterium]